MLDLLALGLPSALIAAIAWAGALILPALGLGLLARLITAIC